MTTNNWPWEGGVHDSSHQSENGRLWGCRDNKGEPERLGMRQQGKRSYIVMHIGQFCLLESVRDIYSYFIGFIVPCCAGPLASVLGNSLATV